MYRIYIADDETIIRNGLINGIDWTGLNCQVIGNASDGKRAYNEILDLHPDILLTDIKMPFLDGLEMIALLREQRPQLYIIVITGYNEFSFAQRAVKLGVYDFILKPIDIDYLSKVILDIENKIHTYQSARHAVSLFSNFREDLGDSAAQALWNAIFSPSSTEFCISSMCDSRNLTAGLCMIIQIDDYFKMIEDMTISEQKNNENTICSCIAESLKDFEHVYCLARGNAEFLFVLFGENGTDLEKNRRELTAKLRLLLDRRLNCTATSSIGTVLCQTAHIRQSYLEAEEALQYKFMYGHSSDIFYATVKIYSDKYNYDYMSSFQTIISSIATGIPEQAIEEAERSLFCTSAHLPFHASLNKLAINNIILGCVELLSAINISLYEIFPDFPNLYRDLISSDSDAKIRESLSSVIYQVSSIYNLSKTNLISAKNPIVSDAKAYIEQHCSDCRLHLSQIAEALSVSTCYLSNIFKQETGKTYIDYLTSIRIKKAKELLSDLQLKTYEVCYLVGYDNPTYFSTLFKRRTGLTPTEYRNQLMSTARDN